MLDVFEKDVKAENHLPENKNISEEAIAFLRARDFLFKYRTDYQTAYKDFKWPEMTHFNWALDYFDKIAKGNPNPALWLVGEEGEQKYTFDELYRRSNQVANLLLARGVKPSDRIMICLPNVEALWVCMLAAMKIRAVLVPSSTLLSSTDILTRLDAASIRHVITCTSEVKKFEDLSEKYPFNGILTDGYKEGWHSYLDLISYSEEYQSEIQTKATEPFLLYFTSGTTSKPKLVTHTHMSYPVGHLSTMYWHGTQPNDMVMNISTSGWAKHAWGSFFAPWNAEACILSYTSRFNPKRVLDVIEKYRVTVFCAPPSAWRALRQEPLENYKDKIFLREVLSAGEPLNSEVICDVKQRLGVDIREGYGQTEMTAAIGYSPGQHTIPDTMGFSLPGYSVALINENLEQVDEGELSIAVKPIRPTGLMSGYSDEERNKLVMKEDIYLTGDIACRDKRNPLTFSFIGRKDILFKSSGYLISPFKLESVAIKHPSVLDVAVIPSFDPIKGAIPKACIVLREGFKPNNELAREIFNLSNEILSAQEKIRLIEFFDALPKTASSKIQHFELKKREEDINEIKPVVFSLSEDAIKEKNQEKPKM